MSYFNKSVAYLENQDFDSMGNLVAKIPKNMPMLVMAQASWCPHCVNAKPAFQSFADNSQGRVFCATIQSDGERDSEKLLGKRIQKIIPGFQGFPTFFAIVNGDKIVHEGGRDEHSLEQFINMVSR